MTSEWFDDSFSNSELAVPFQKISPTTWMQRKNIRKVTKESEEGSTYTIYECEARTISNDEYEDLMSQLISPAQEQTNNYQLDILGALTDLYEMLGGV